MGAERLRPLGMHVGTAAAPVRRHADPGHGVERAYGRGPERERRREGPAGAIQGRMFGPDAIDGLPRHRAATEPADVEHARPDARVSLPRDVAAAVIFLPSRGTNLFGVSTPEDRAHGRHAPSRIHVVEQSRIAERQVRASVLAVGIDPRRTAFEGVMTVPRRPVEGFAHLRRRSAQAYAVVPTILSGSLFPTVPARAFISLRSCIARSLGGQAGRPTDDVTAASVRSFLLGNRLEAVQSRQASGARIPRVRASVSVSKGGMGLGSSASNASRPSDPKIGVISIAFPKRRIRLAGAFAAARQDSAVSTSFQSASIPRAPPSFASRGPVAEALVPA